MSDPRRRLPPVNLLVTEIRAAGRDGGATRTELVAAIRAVLDDARAHAGNAPP